MHRDSWEVEDELPALQKDRNILRSPDLLLIPDDDNGHVFTPPARIAARFHRSASNRRRSSAASSRRNSLSSTHSHHSARSFRSSCQSSHVAQHLRRASILESRKARLADKAVHAEQVRLRAALVKSTPRSSNSEEKALAAHQAREKYLAKVAASCAEEVNRAMKVARDMKERKAAAEEHRCRLEMGENHAEAGKQKLEYRRGARRPRTGSIHAAEDKKSGKSYRNALTEVSASKRIQRAWRQSKRRRCVKQFLAMDLCIDHIRRIGFMEASTLLADVGLIASARQIMSLMNLDVGSEPDNTNVRRFLSTFMILGYPSDVFNKNGQQESDLINKAKEVLICLEAILSEFTNSSACTASPTQLETLSQAYASYVTAFEAWKTRDATVLVGTMIDQFVALDAIWQTVKGDTRGEVADDYREGIRDNQVILLSKIKKLAGSDRANALIKRAIRESRRTRSQSRMHGDVRPRTMAASDVTPDFIPSEAFSSSTAVSQLGEVGEPASRQNLQLGDLSRVFSVVPPNRVTVHELLIDPNYKIEVSPHSDVRSALNRAMCENMRRGIEAGLDEIWTVAVAENIRKRLLRLLREGHSMYHTISEVLDPAHIRNQCRRGLFSYENFFSWIADFLPRLCAPVRDVEIRAFVEVLRSTGDSIGAMVEKLFGLFHIIDVISLDYTNFLIHQVAPTLILEAPGYEQRLFAQDLESKLISLHKTKRWWRYASVNLLTEATHDDSPIRATFGRIYARGLVDLAVGTNSLQDADVPETLNLDKERLSRIRSSMLRFTVIGAILLTAKNLLKRDVRSQWKPEAKRIFESIKDGYYNKDGNLSARILATIESSHGMPQPSREQLANIITRFLAEAQSGHLTDPVLKLLMQRLKVHIFNRLAATSSSERIRVASTASEGLAGIGLSEFIGQVSDIAEVLRKVTSIDQDAHGVWYAQIADELEQMSGAGA